MNELNRLLKDTKADLRQYLSIKSLFFYLHGVMKTVGGVKIP